MIEDGSVIEETGTGNAKSLKLASNRVPTPEADAERELWEDYPHALIMSSMSPGLVPEDKEDIESDIQHVQLDIHLDNETPRRGLFDAITDAELEALLDDEA